MRAELAGREPGARHIRLKMAGAFPTWRAVWVAALRHGTAVNSVTRHVGVAVGIADQIAVNYGGRFVETGPVRESTDGPGHPHTHTAYTHPGLDLSQG